MNFVKNCGKYCERNILKNSARSEQQYALQHRNTGTKKCQCILFSEIILKIIIILLCQCILDTTQYNIKVIFIASAVVRKGGRDDGNAQCILDTTQKYIRVIVIASAFQFIPHTGYLKHSKNKRKQQQGKRQRNNSNYGKLPWN